MIKTVIVSLMVHVMTRVAVLGRVKTRNQLIYRHMCNVFSATVAVSFGVCQAETMSILLKGLYLAYEDIAVKTLSLTSCTSFLSYLLPVSVTRHLTSQAVRACSGRRRFLPSRHCKAWKQHPSSGSVVT